jgi:hypothetical protein
MDEWMNDVVLFKEESDIDVISSVGWIAYL